MTRHEIHVRLQQINFDITTAVSTFFIVNIMLGIDIIAALSNPSYLLLITLFSLLHAVVFDKCMSGLVADKEQLENMLKTKTKLLDDDKKT